MRLSGVTSRLTISPICETMSAQACADLFVSELREEGFSMDEAMLAESVATALLQQRLDLLELEESTVEQVQAHTYCVMGAGKRRLTGEKVEFMSSLRLWWSGDRVQCDSLGLVWR